MEERKMWRRRRLRRIFRVLKVFLIGAAIVLSVGILCRINELRLEMLIQGDRDVYVEYGEEYKDSGAIPVLIGKYVFSEGIPLKLDVSVDNRVDQSRVGRYPVVYRASLLGLQAKAVRSVWVVDTQCPEIMLIGETDVESLTDGVYHDEGFRAYDNYDGDITHRVIRKEEVGRITYGVADSSGNPAYAVRIIPNYDPIAPILSLNGEQYLKLNPGEPYVEAGFYAEDNVDGDITHLVEVEGTVDCFTPGIYPITYRVTDSYENTTAVTRTVEVVKHEKPQIVEPEGKVIYLPFDDGPGAYTRHLLSVLDKYDVKATFFVVDNGNDALLREIVDQGHSIGIHTRNHRYDEIYASPEAFFADLYGMQEVIYEATGVRTTLMRFPGGSSNTISSNVPGLMTLLTQAVRDAGFRYFDWNVDSGDASDSKNVDDVLSHVKQGVLSQKYPVVLQHDIHAFSVGAVEEIIRWGLENGYTFLPLDMSSPEVVHIVVN